MKKAILLIVLLFAAMHSAFALDLDSKHVAWEDTGLVLTGSIEALAQLNDGSFLAAGNSNDPALGSRAVIYRFEQEWQRKFLSEPEGDRAKYRGIHALYQAADGSVYAGTEKALLYSQDNGNTWQVHFAFLENVTVADIIEFNGKLIVAMDDGSILEYNELLAGWADVLPSPISIGATTAAPEIISALKVIDEMLYASGRGLSAGNAQLGFVCRTENTTEWECREVPGVPTVTDIEFANNKLYAAGHVFTLEELTAYVFESEFLAGQWGNFSFTGFSVENEFLWELFKSYEGYLYAAGQSLYKFTPDGWKRVAMRFPVPLPPETTLTMYELIEEKESKAVYAAGSAYSEAEGREGFVIKTEFYNSAPVANAGLSQAVEAGETITLNGLQSSDPEGDTLSYSWIQVAGQPMQLDDWSSAQPSFTVGSVGESYSFMLSVADSFGGTSTANVTINVKKEIAAAEQDYWLLYKEFEEPELATQPAILGTEGGIFVAANKFYLLAGKEIEEIGTFAGEESPIKIIEGNNGEIYILNSFSLPDAEETARLYKYENNQLTLFKELPYAAKDIVALSDGLLLLAEDIAGNTGYVAYDPAIEEWAEFFAVGEEPGIVAYRFIKNKAADKIFLLYNFVSRKESEKVIGLNWSAAAAIDFEELGEIKNIHGVGRLGHAIAVDDSDGIFIGTERLGEVFYSADGKDFYTKGSIADEIDWLEFANNKLFVKVYNFGARGFSVPDLIISKDGGETWEKLPGIEGAGISNTLHIGNITVAGGKVFVATAGSPIKIYKLMSPAENNAPIANAGLDQRVNLGDAVTLDGSLSSDPDNDSLQFLWEQVAGPTATIENAASAVASFTASNIGTLEFRLTVADEFGATSSDTVEIIVEETCEENAVAQCLVEGCTGEKRCIDGTWTECTISRICEAGEERACAPIINGKECAELAGTQTCDSCGSSLGECRAELANAVCCPNAVEKCLVEGKAGTKKCSARGQWLGCVIGEEKPREEPEEVGPPIRAVEVVEEAVAAALPWEIIAIVIIIAAVIGAIILAPRFLKKTKA